ncbi:MAG: methylmalonyl Co-A mutase-associated GTPase MeaB [Pseudomonadota bacterium]
MSLSLETLATGSKVALARALAQIEAAPEAPETAALLDAAFAAPKGQTLGLTGPPGVGKSTLIRALISHWRGRGQTVAVIAVDPSSRRSGGALLGDRTRLSTDPEDQGLFVRSMAARERLGGLAEITFPAMILMRALYDRVIVETVGVGQSETEVAGLCDTVVFCAQPGSGDALQFMKAGVIEIPDVFAVTKADLGLLARRTVADLRGALSLVAGEGPVPEVVACSAERGEGIKALVEAIEARAGALDAQSQAKRWLESHLNAAYGRAGVRFLAQAGLDTHRPFTAATALGARIATVFEQALSDPSLGAPTPPKRQSTQSNALDSGNDAKFTVSVHQSYTGQ